MERNLDLEAQGIFPEGDIEMANEKKNAKVRYEVIQTRSGQLFVIRGGWSAAGNKVSDIYSLAVIPTKDQGVTITITRLDQGTLLAESDGLIHIKEHVIDLAYFLKDDAQLIREIGEADKIAGAKNSGIILPQDNPGVIR
jgi:hypothetical protein